MKFVLENRTLSLAIAISITAHAALLAIRFAAPEAFRFKPTDPGLEVILVNAKHNKKPVKADALAQANLDGGGNAEAGRAKSPLPDLRKSEDGDSARVAQRRIEELEAQQRKLLAHLTQSKKFAASAGGEHNRPNTLVQPNGADSLNSMREIARREAEIAKNIEDYNKRPRKTQITPSTREVGYAMYYKTLQDKIEKVGTLNFPKKNGKKLYGELVVYIPIYQDGSVYEKDGGPRVERSSGNKDLDRAAMKIVRGAAPFGRFPANMRSTDKDDVWEVITRFKFTRENGLEAELRGGSS